MPPGAKKRKALKKKKEQEAIGTGTNNKGFNGHGNDEHGSQDEGESDGNLSSPGSQGNGEFWTRDRSPSPLSGLGKVSGKEKTEDADVTMGQEAKVEDFIAVERGTDHEENGVDKPSNPFPENVTHNTIKSASQEAGGSGTSVLEVSPAVDSVKLMMDSSVSKVVISDINEQVESSTSSDSDENEEKYRLKEAKEGSLPGSAAETSKEIKSAKASEVPECSEEKESLLPSGPPVARTSWLSCCGLFDVMAGSQR